MRTRTLYDTLDPRMGPAAKNSTMFSGRIIFRAGLLLIALLVAGFGAYQFTQPPVSSAKENAVPPMVYDASAAMEGSIVRSWEVKPAVSAAPKVYDATAAMEKSVVRSWEVRPAVSAAPVVYDATEAMEKSVVRSWEMGPGVSAPPLVYDATGAMIEAIGFLP